MLLLIHVSMPARCPQKRGFRIPGSPSRGSIFKTNGESRREPPSGRFAWKGALAASRFCAVAGDRRGVRPLRRKPSRRKPPPPPARRRRRRCTSPRSQNHFEPNRRSDNKYRSEFRRVRRRSVARTSPSSQRGWSGWRRDIHRKRASAMRDSTAPRSVRRAAVWRGIATVEIGKSNGAAPRKSRHPGDGLIRWRGKSRRHRQGRKSIALVYILL